ALLERLRLRGEPGGEGRPVREGGEEGRHRGALPLRRQAVGVSRGTRLQRLAVGHELSEGALQRAQLADGRLLTGHQLSSLAGIDSKAIATSGCSEDGPSPAGVSPADGAVSPPDSEATPSRDASGTCSTPSSVWTNPASLPLSSP